MWAKKIIIKNPTKANALLATLPCEICRTYLTYKHCTLRYQPVAHMLHVFNMQMDQVLCHCVQRIGPNVESDTHTHTHMLSERFTDRG